MAKVKIIIEMLVYSVIFFVITMTILMVSGTIE